MPTAEQAKVIELQQKADELQKQAAAANPEGHYLSAERQGATAILKWKQFESQREIKKAEAQAAETEYQNMIAANPELAAYAKEHPATQYEIKTYSRGVTGYDPTSQPDRARNKADLDVRRTEMIFGIAQANPSYSISKISEAYNERSSSLLPQNVTVNYEATLAARQQGLNVGSAIYNDLPETYQKEWEKQFRERNKIISLTESFGDQRPKTQTDYYVGLTEGGITTPAKASKEKAISLTEGRPRTPRNLTQEQVNKLSDRDYAIYQSEFAAFSKYQKQESKKETLASLANVKEFGIKAQKAGAPIVILDIGGVKKEVRTENLYREFVAAKREGKEISLEVPTTINLTESLGFESGQMQKAKISQDKQGAINTLLSVPKETISTKAYAFEQVIPLSVGKNELTGISRKEKELVTYDLTPDKRTIYTTPLTEAIDTGSEWIKELNRVSKARLKENPLDPLGKAGLYGSGVLKEGYSIVPFGHNVIQEFVTPGMVEPSGKKKEFAPAKQSMTGSFAAMEDISKGINPLSKGSTFERYTRELTTEEKAGEFTGFIAPLLVGGPIKGAETLTLFARQSLGLVTKRESKGIIESTLEKIRPLSPMAKAKILTKALDPTNIYGIEAIKATKLKPAIEAGEIGIPRRQTVFEKAVQKIAKKEPDITAKAATLEESIPIIKSAEEAVPPKPIEEILPKPEPLTPIPQKTAGISRIESLTSQISGRIAAITGSGASLEIGARKIERGLGMVKQRLIQPSRYVGYIGIEGGEAAPKAKVKEFDFMITARGKKKPITPKEKIKPKESKTPAIVIDTGKKGLTGIVKSEPRKTIENQLGVIISGDLPPTDIKRLGLKRVSDSGGTPLFTARLPKGAKERTEFLLRIGEAEKTGFITRVTDIEFLPTKDALRYAAMKFGDETILGSEKAMKYATKTAPYYEARQVLGATREVKVKGLEKSITIEEAFKLGKLPKTMSYDVEIGKKGLDKYLESIGLSSALEPTKRASKTMRGFEDFKEPIKESKGFAGSEGKARAISKEKALDIAKQISPLTQGVREKPKIIHSYGMTQTAIDSSAALYETEVTGKYNISPFQNEKRIEITEPRIDFSTGEALGIKPSAKTFTGLRQPSLLGESLKQVQPTKTDTGLRIETITKAGLKEQEKLRSDLLSKLRIDNVLRSDTQTKLRVREVEKLATVQKQQQKLRTIPKLTEKIPIKEKFRTKIAPFTWPKIEIERKQREKRSKTDTKAFIGNVLEESVEGVFKGFDIKTGQKAVSKQAAIGRAITRKGRDSFVTSRSNKSPFGNTKNRRIRF